MKMPITMIAPRSSAARPGLTRRFGAAAFAGFICNCPSRCTTAPWNGKTASDDIGRSGGMRLRP